MGRVNVHPPGTQPPRRFRPRLHWELLICSVSGHELVGTDAAELRDEDSLFAREDAHGARWYRCLRCDSWLALAPPAEPAREHPPAREEIELPLRGKPLRDKVVLRVIALDRAFHFLVLVALGVLVLLFAADRRTLRHTFYKVVADLQGGVAASQTHARTGCCTRSTTPSRPPRRICTWSAACCSCTAWSRASRASACGCSGAGRST